MNIRMITLIALAVLFMVGFASAAETVDKVEVRGTIVDTAAGTAPAASVCVAGNLVSCTWYPYDFDAFWYNLDDNLYSETLSIDTAAMVGGNGPLGIVTTRTLDEKELIYSTHPQLIGYEVAKEYNGVAGAATVTVNGAEDETVASGDLNDDADIMDTEVGYAVIGWWAEKYVGINGRADKLAKLLVEFKSTDKKILATGEVWDLGGGFTLTAKQIDPGSNTVLFQLNKSGTEIDSTIVGKEYATAQDMLYVVNKDIAGETNIPIFVAHVDAISTGIVQLKYVWLMSDEVIEIKTGDEFGEFKVDQAGPAWIRLSNDDAITLSPAATIDLGGMEMKVADDATTIRFYPMVEKTEPGTYEVRGTIVDPDAVPPKAPATSVVAPGALTSCTWDSYDFAAFWYDLDDDLWTETLQIDTTVDAANGPIGLAGPNRALDKKELIYTTVPQLIGYEVAKEYNGATIAADVVTVKGAEDETVASGDLNGDADTVDTEVGYAVVGWWAEKYVGINGRADKLAKLLVEFKSTDKKTLSTGESWDLGGGFMLTAKQIDPVSNTVLFQLNKSGTEIDSTIVGKKNATAQDMLYVVNKDIAGEINIPIFVAYVDAIFNETGSDLIQLKYVWLISDEVTEISSGDTFGKFKIGTCGAAGVTAENEDTITLSKNTVIDLYEGMKIKVADDTSSVRFYPLVERTIGGDPTPPPPATIPANDTDGDGVPDVWDADNSTQEGYWVNPQGIGRRWGDMNGDGVLTSVDALMILQAAADRICL